MPKALVCAMSSRARASSPALPPAFGMSHHRISVPRPARSAHAETRSAIARSGASVVASDSRTPIAAVRGRGSGRRGRAVPAPSAKTVARPGPRVVSPAGELDSACLAYRGGGGREPFEPVGIGRFEGKREGRPACRRGPCGEPKQGGAEDVAGDAGRVIVCGERRRRPGMDQRQAAGVEQRRIVTDTEHGVGAPRGAVAEAARDELEFVHGSAIDGDRGRTSPARGAGRVSPSNWSVNASGPRRRAPPPGVVAELRRHVRRCARVR